MNNHNHSEKLFTSDTALAAYLIYLGFSADIRDSDFPASFRFAHSPDLDKAVADWETGMATGNVRLFYNSYRMLLKRIKGDK